MFDTATLEILMGKFVVGMLFFVRISGMMITGPFFKNTAIIPQVKIFLSFFLAIAMTSAFSEEQPPIDFHLWYMLLLVIKEFGVGAIIGFATNMVFFAARFAGGLIDFDMGYHTASLFTQEQTSPTLVGELQNLAALMLFLFLNGHHFVIESLYASARAVPLTYFTVTESTIELLVKLATSIFIIAVKMAAPILVALFLTNLALALLARVAPQTNIFILSFQMKILVGLLTLIGGVPLFILMAKYGLNAMETETMKILMSLNPGRV